MVRPYLFWLTFIKTDLRTVQRHTLPMRLMGETNSSSIVHHLLRNIVRDPLASDEANAKRRCPSFPKSQNVFNEVKELWPKYADNRPMYTVYRARDMPIFQHEDDDSVVQDIKTSLVPYNPDRLYKGRQVRRRLEAYQVTKSRPSKSSKHVLPILGKLLLYPNATMTYDTVAKSDIHFWATRRRDALEKSREVHLATALSRSDSTEEIDALQRPPEVTPSFPPSVPSLLPQTPDNSDAASSGQPDVAMFDDMSSSEMPGFDENVDLELDPDLIELDEEQNMANWEQMVNGGLSSDQKSPTDRTFNPNPADDEEKLWSGPYEIVRARMARILTNRGKFFTFKLLSQSISLSAPLSKLELNAHFNAKLCKIRFSRKARH